MYIDQLRRLREQEAGQASRPRGTALLMRIAVVGMLVLPIVTALAMAGWLGGPDSRDTIVWSVGGLWAVCFLAAMVLAGTPASLRR